MNYLAHLALSGPDRQTQLGGFLGDWLKGPLDNHRDQWPEAVLRGVALHRRIDGWVDQQPEVAEATALLGPHYRRLAGPVLDIVFDHFLAQDFERLHQQPLADFCRPALAALAREAQQMPDGAARFLQRVREHRLFERYADEAVMLDVVLSLQRRLSRPALLDGIALPLSTHSAALQHCFLSLYPRLQQFSGAVR